MVGAAPECTMDPKIVKMLKNYGNNNAGEQCGFSPAVADKLIAQGIAEPVPQQKQVAKIEK